MIKTQVLQRIVCARASTRISMCLCSSTVFMFCMTMSFFACTCVGKGPEKATFWYFCQPSTGFGTSILSSYLSPTDSWACCHKSNHHLRAAHRSEGSCLGWGLGRGGREGGRHCVSLALPGMADFSDPVSRHPEKCRVGCEGTGTAFTWSWCTTGDTERKHLHEERYYSSL